MCVNTKLSTQLYTGFSVYHSQHHKTHFKSVNSGYISTCKVKVKLSCNRHAGTKGERRYSPYSFFTLALEGSGQHHALTALYSWERTPGTHCIGHWVGLRVGLDTEAREKILFLCQGSNPGRPVSSHTAYSLSYPSFLNLYMYLKKTF
jgi:hypothetical protein